MKQICILSLLTILGLSVQAQDSVLFAGESHFKNVIQLTKGETMPKLIGVLIASVQVFKEPIQKKGLIVIKFLWAWFRLPAQKVLIIN